PTSPDRQLSNRASAPTTLAVAAGSPTGPHGRPWVDWAVMGAVAPDQRLAGRYVLEELVATGGMATVWRALDEVLARPVAVKVLRSELARGPRFFSRFRAEPVAAARPTHPCLTSAFDTGVHDHPCFTLTQHFQGRTLRAITDGRAPLRPAAPAGP